uniref:Putative secreted protein n=1 Tax=Lutzomyia longipalpis TaxID=7200 RepID=A0A7G3AGU5_LUTLO
MGLYAFASIAVLPFLPTSGLKDGKILSLVIFLVVLSRTFFYGLKLLCPSLVSSPFKDLDLFTRSLHP